MVGDCTSRELRIDELLDLAIVKPGARDAARKRLSEMLSHGSSETLESNVPLAHLLRRAVEPGVVSRDVNLRLEKLRKRAADLLYELRALRNYPDFHTYFWAQDIFGSAELQHFLRPIDPALPIETEVGLERIKIIQAVQDIVSATQRAKNKRKNGRPSNTHKQFIVDMAAHFWNVFASLPLGGTPDGKFYVFAETFYNEVTGREESIERQVKAAVSKANEYAKEYGQKSSDIS